MRVLLVLVGVVPTWAVALADEVHLASGAVIEGAAEDAGDDVLLVTTPSGVLGIPGGIVIRVVPGPTRWTIYERESQAQPLTAQRHVELARLCAKLGFDERRTEHARLALELDPTLPDALTEAGYVPVGQVWLRVAWPLTPEDQQRRDAARLAHRQEVLGHLVRGWQWHLRSLRDGLLVGTDRNGVSEGRRRVLALDDPLVTPAACKMLSTGSDPGVRLLLVEYLAAHPSDFAEVNLLALTLGDDEAAVREAATNALSQRPDRRVSDLLRLALGCVNDRLVRRAAEAAGRMRDRATVPALIEALHAPRPAETAPDALQIMEAAVASLNGPLLVPLDEETVAYPSAVAIEAWERTSARRMPRGAGRAGTRRTEVQEALIAITGQNYGFDQDAWRAWLRENPPLPDLSPPGGW